MTGGRYGLHAPARAEETPVPRVQTRERRAERKPERVKEVVNALPTIAFFNNSNLNNHMKKTTIRKSEGPFKWTQTKDSITISLPVRNVSLKNINVQWTDLCLKVNVPTIRYI